MPAKPLIQVVDDEEAVRSSLMTILKTYGFEVETFGSGQEFLAVVADRQLGRADVCTPAVPSRLLTSRARTGRAPAGAAGAVRQRHGVLVSARGHQQRARQYDA